MTDADPTEIVFEDDDDFDFEDEDDGKTASFVPFKPKRTAKRPALAAPPDAVLTDTPTSEDTFHTTYTPSRHEKGWLLQSLMPFYEQDLLSDVLASVKGGKEASVYRCLPTPAMVESLGVAFLAAKVYRPRQFRNLRNDAVYREGRATLTADGREAKKSDSRLMRALDKKTDFGKSVAHTSWLMYEYTTLETLHRAGASVPRPLAASENALLMEFIGDTKTGQPAPTLIETGGFTPERATELLRDVLRNIEILLAHGLIHGDLSAYNILYHAGKITLIDFPQVTKIETNPHAFDLLSRDITRVCDYFARQSVAPKHSDPAPLVQSLWRRFGPQ